jgi:hypothetical protein
MAVLSAIRTYLGLAIAIAAVCAAAAWVPGLVQRVQVPAGYGDHADLQPFSGRWLAPGPYGIGDLVAYRYGVREGDVGFGRVVALAGEGVRIERGVVMASGADAGFGAVPGLRRLPSVGPMIVPAGHVYVLSDHHGRDSSALGPIAPGMLLGRVRE